MHPTALRCAFALAATVALAVPASAQNLASLIPDLLGTRIVLDNPFHAAHFTDQSAALAQTGETLNQSLVEQLSSFPIASSAGGFTYVLDPTLGTFSRSTDSFGPVYTERVQTIGKGKWNFGFNYLQASYDKLDDLDLATGDIQFQLHHVDTDDDDDGAEPPVPFFEGDLIGVRTALEVDAQTTVLFANVGLSDRFDLSLAVPVVNVELAASSTLNINRLATGAGSSIHRFQNGTDTLVISDHGSASGVGDVLLRGKLRFGAADDSGLAAALDVRFPTGDENDLLGAGLTQTKLTFIGTAGFGRVALHGNAGYSIASGSSDLITDPPDELSYAAALDFAVHPRVTIAGELVGRTLLDATQAVLGSERVSFHVGSSTGPVETRDVPQVTFAKEDLQLLLGSFGVKFNPAGNLLISLDALFPLSNDGLVDDDVIIVGGAEYSF